MLGSYFGAFRFYIYSFLAENPQRIVGGGISWVRQY